MSISTALDVRDLCANFGATPGLRSISLAIADRERVVIVGPSGAGKTTLLRAISGLSAVTAGRVIIGGHDCSAAAPETRSAVYMHQTPMLFSHLSVFENVAFPLRVRNVADDEIRARVNSILGDVQLAGMGPRYPTSLSGGQQHRVALARAINARPRVLLLDEPLSSLDPSLRDDVRDVLLSLVAQHNIAVLMTTHDLDEASRVADRIGVLVGGALLQLSPARQIFSCPSSTAVARALGMRNSLRGTLHGDRIECALGAAIVSRDHVVSQTVPVRPADSLSCTVLLLHGAATVFEDTDRGAGLRDAREREGAPGEIVRVYHRADAAVALVRVGTEFLELPVGAACSFVAGASVVVTLDASRVRIYPD